MFSRIFLRRRAARRYVWAPAIDFSDRRIAGTLMLFGRTIRR